MDMVIALTYISVPLQLYFILKDVKVTQRDYGFADLRFFGSIFFGIYFSLCLTNHPLFSLEPFLSSWGKSDF
jgi:hypothetical protein